MNGTHEAAYRSMFQGMVWRMVLVSLVPLTAIGVADFWLFSDLNRTIVVEQHANSLRTHRESIQAFLDNVTTELSTLAHQYTIEELKAGDLDRIFRVIRQQAGVFTDVGIIDSDGRHVRYVGPYDLSGRNYRQTEWFAQVAEKGVFVSDVFLGFRGVPHFIIAVKRQQGAGFWILRATVDADYFNNLVDASRIGRTGETFIVNSSGLYQTAPRFGGGLLEPAGYPDLTPHDDIRVSRLEQDGREYLYTATWLSNPRWLLIFRQEIPDVFSPLWNATLWGILMFLAGAVVAVASAVVVARRQVRMIRHSDEEKEVMAQRLLVTGKTAAVGEMSAGLAHEINNPLATIDTLRTWIEDLTSSDPIPPEDRAEIVDSARKIGEQVARCKEVTQGLLHFSRRVESRPEEVDVNQIVSELASMARTRARVENVEVEFVQGRTPPVFASPTHLQQVFVNIVNNAIDAVSDRPGGKVVIRTSYSRGRVRVAVSDNGDGIKPELMSRIFLPFFTTKPPGKGTGLGLAICYGLVQKLGGTIQVDSMPGQGATFTVLLPAVEAAEETNARYP